MILPPYLKTVEIGFMFQALPDHCKVNFTLLGVDRHNANLHRVTKPVRPCR